MSELQRIAKLKIHKGGHLKSKWKNLKRRIILIIVAVYCISFLKCSHASDQANDVKVITLSESDVALPSGHSQLDLRRVDKRNTNYIFKREGDEDHLYFVTGNDSQEVVGDVPIMKGNQAWRHPGSDFSWFIDGPRGEAVTYVTYTKIRGEGAAEAADLYVLQGNKMNKLLSHLRVAAINGLDTRTPINCYVDKRGYLYALTQDEILYVIGDGRILGKADVSNIGANPPAIPSMFSDDENTYFLVPKLFNSMNSMTSYGFVAESQLKAKYKINY